MNAESATRDFGEIEGQYRALGEAVGLVDPGPRTQLELAGRDRALLLHNLATNEIRTLPAGAGCETFLTDAQGKTIGHGYVFVGPENLVFETVAGQAQPLVAHFDRYTIREDVSVRDRSGEWTELLLAGPQSGRLLAELTGAAPPLSLWHHATVPYDRWPLSLRRVDWTGGEAYLASLEAAGAAALRRALVDAGARPCGTAAFEARRIEAGTPQFGRDIGPRNLPQEVDRNAQAISFVKGCYLGQETVARIDALGHVNRLLVGVVFRRGDIPGAGLELRAGEQAVGQVTSAAYSPRKGTAVGLACVRREHALPGSALASLCGPAEVSRLPIA